MYHYTLQKKNDTDSYDLIRDEDNKEHMHQNSLLDLMMILLKDVDNSLNSLYKSIDNDTLLITDLVDGLSRPLSHQAEPYNFGALHEQVTRRNDYVTGKVGIGPFALNVTNNILTYLYGVQFNPELKICKETLIGRLDRLVDMDGNSISAWLSAFINAHVDIVKDPYISLFNVNSYTYNMVNLLIRSGYGYRAMKFLTQPVIVEMAKASNNFNSKYAKDKKNIKDRETTIMDAASMVIYGETGKINKTTIDIENRKNSHGVHCVKKVMKDIEEGNPVNQDEVLHAFILLQPFALSLSNLVKYTKIDTRKQGKNFMETLNYYDGYQRLFHNRTGSGKRIIKPGGSIWDLKSLKDLSEMSWIEDKTINGIMEPIKVLANLTFNANSEFRDNVLNYANVLNYNTEDEGNTEALKLLSQQAATLIKQRFFNNYASKVLGRNIQSLFVGNKSVAAKLDRLKFLILTDPEYKHLLGNAFLERLTSAPQQNVMKVGYGSAVAPRFINVVKSLDGGAIEENPIIDGWYDLLNDPKTLKISRELVVYAFLTSGERKGFSNLFKFVPPEFLRGELENSTIDGTSFVKHVERMLTEPGAIDARLNLDEIVQNNYDEYSFVKKMSLTRKLDKKTILNFNFVGNPSDINSPLVLISNNDSVTETEYPYLAINKKNKTSNRSENTNLYKMVSPGIYILMPKKGYAGKGKTRIYEYGASYGFAFNEILGYEYNKFQKAFEYLLLFISHLNPDRNNSILSHAEYMADPRVSSFIAKHMMDYVNGNIKIDINDVVNWMTDTVENRPTLDLKQQSDAKQETKTIREKDDPENFNTPQEDVLVLSSERTILSNEELAMWNENGVGPDPKILTASEHTDPVAYVDKLIRILNGEEYVERWGWKDGKRVVTDRLTGHDFNGLYIITKHDGLPIKRLLETKIPKLIHFSITGLGSTKYEPGAMKPDDLLDRIQDLIKQGLDPNIITIRIDPIVPGVTEFSVIENIIKRSSEMGIKRIKFSIMDMYPKIVKTMEGLGYNIGDYYAWIPDHMKFDKKLNKEVLVKAHWNFTAKKEVIDPIINFMVQMKQKYNISLHTCAEKINHPEILKEGCLAVSAVNKMLGTNIEEKYEQNNKQRDWCTCLGGKIEGLAYDDKCVTVCGYCYAGHNGEKAMLYYNENGTLKDMPLTRTREEPRVVLPKSKEAQPAQQGTNTDGIRKELVIANSAKRSDLLAKVKEVHGVITTRPNGADWFKTPGMHFGNPFSFADYAGVKVLVKDAHEAVVAYEQWLRGEKYQEIEPQRRLWILDKINKGQLDNRPLVYYTNGVKDTDGQRKIYDYDIFPNHAHILLKLINEHKQNALVSQQQTTPQETTTSSNTLNESNINIYAGKNENTDLSNFATRPFTINGLLFLSVELGFQFGKFDLLKSVIQFGYTETDSALKDIIQQINSILKSILNLKRSDYKSDLSFGAALRKLGNTRLNPKDSDIREIIDSFFSNNKRDGYTNWNAGNNASNVMSVLIKESFKQNPNALQRLLSTGDAMLTHNQDNSKWKTEFPRILMEVREELRSEVSTTTQQKQPKTSVIYTPKGKTKQIYEVKEDNTGIHIFNKDGKEVFIEKGTADRNKIIANYKWLNGDAVVVEHGGHEYIVMRSGDRRVVIQRITGKTKKFGENNIERQEIIDKANKKFSEKDAADNMQSTISELAKLGEQRKKDCE